MDLYVHTTLENVFFKAYISAIAITLSERPLVHAKVEKSCNDADTLTPTPHFV